MAKNEKLPKLCEMNTAVKRKWIRALRSGKYKRGRGAMRHDFATGSTYCCLGVLCEVTGQEYIGSDGRPDINFVNGIGLSVEAMYACVGLNDGTKNNDFQNHVPTKYRKGWRCLKGTSFNKIADFIRDRM